MIIYYKYNNISLNFNMKLQGTRKVITSDILKAEDPDTLPEDLLYTVLHGKNEANR